MESMTLSSGSRLQGGKYRIVRVLGQGGFGITYEAEQVSLGRRVAVKEFFMKDVCNRDGSTSHVSVPSVGSHELVEKFRQKFVREARMIASMKNPHIVRVHDVFEENGTAYYVMEYLSGGSLADVVKHRGALPEPEALGCIRGIASALSSLHQHDTLHLDVKPSNVMLDEEGEVVLIDFGISKHIDSDGHLTSSTPIGVSKGYAPFEQMAHDDESTFSPATDIYSLGATLYYLLTAKTPRDASALLKSFPTDDLDANGVAPSLISAIRQSMSVAKEDRPQSVAAFLQLLDEENTGSDDDEDTLLSTPKPTPSPTPKPKPKWLWPVVAVLVVGAATFGLLRRPSSPSDGDVLPADIVPTVTEATPVSVTTEPTPTEPVAQTTPEEPAEEALESLSLSKKNLELEEGASATLTAKYMPSNTTDKSTTWESSDESVAKVSPKGKVTAVSAGNAAITAISSGMTAYCNVTVTPKSTTTTPTPTTSTSTNDKPSADATTTPVADKPSGDATTTPVADKPSATSTSGKENGHEWVDLGLSVKWATMNVGATSPEGYGSYFAWGETSPKSEYNWKNMKYRTEGDDYDNVKFSKYVVDGRYGPVDNKTRLELSDDAARANWGGSWRMPTLNEIKELQDNCTRAWTTQNGVEGYKVTSKKNGNSIFLPAAGYRWDDNLNSAGSYGSYWSSTLYPSSGRSSCSLYFGSGDWGWNSYFRCNGLSVRAVCP